MVGLNYKRSENARLQRLRVKRARPQDKDFVIAMTQFLHNLYFFVTTGIYGRRNFEVKSKGGPKNETNLDFRHSRHLPSCWKH
jgi:hypothetical protein